MRYAVKLDFIAGLLAKALRCTGGDEVRSNQVLLGVPDGRVAAVPQALFA